MNKQILSPILEKNAVSFNINDDLIDVVSDLANQENTIQNSFEIGVQTESDWLDQLKRELLFSMQHELSIKEKVPKHPKSKAGTIRSQATKASIARSKKKTESTLEDVKGESFSSSETSESLPIYPERKIDDEYGISLYSSSEDEENPFDVDKLSSLVNEDLNLNQRNSNEEEMAKAIQNNMIFDAGLPASLKVSKELGGNSVEPPMSADAFLASAMIPKPGDVCEFCRKPLIPIPSVQEQIDSNIDQAKLFCCQEFRELVDFALAHRQVSNSTNDKQIKPQLIDITPHKSHKTPEEIAEDRAKSEKKIRERLLERQNAALIAAQTARMKIDGPRRAYSEMPSALSAIDDENELNFARQSTESVMTRQLRVINYQLSSCKFMEDGWTIRPPTISNEEITAKGEMKDIVFNMDYTSLIQDIYGQMGLSEECSSIGVVRKFYPDGQLFLIVFPTGSASIYYPSGNLAISIIRETIDKPMICVIQDDLSTFEAKNHILGIVSTNGFGSFSHITGEMRFSFDTLSGFEIMRDGSKKRHWYWNGKPHVHAPPFQPLFFSINRYIGIRISSQNGVFINFFSVSRQIHINVGVRSKIPDRVQHKMHNMVKVEMETLMKPLNDIKRRLEKCQETFGQSTLVHQKNEKKLPVKPFTLAKISTDRKTTISLSMV